jgi:peptidoglycan/xylan/chitin deacetylase (PgdA/CDA1 family)
LQGDSPLISVVIPAYNRETTIVKTLDSLQEQTYAGWEAIVVDDGSGDRTAEVVEEYARADNRFQVHRQPNQGVSAARNAGIACARNPWLFFLDADDWIASTALATLLKASDAVSAQIDAVYGGYIRIDGHGRELRERRPEHDEDLFPVFTRMCAFAIHTCLVRTELVRDAGGFDETLVTCEDWDLWQRIARMGARFASIPDYLAYYRMRVGSASANGKRMLDDGLKVIARGHGEDARLLSVSATHRAGAPASGRALASAYFVCYAAGLVMAEGGDASPMLDALGEDRPPDIDPDGIAETLFYAVPNGRAASPEDWPSFPPEVLRRCRQFIDAIDRWMRDSWLGFQTRRSIERLMLTVDEDAPRPRTAGSWHLIELDCAGDPPTHITADSQVENLRCAVRVGTSHLGEVELPVCAGWVSPRVLADGVAAQLPWEILRAWLARVVYPSLEVERSGSLARVSRDGMKLLEQEVSDAYPFEQWLHDRIGWTLLLQELWGRGSWPSDWFYSDHPEPRSDRRASADRAPVPVEITEALPLVSGRGESSAAIGVTLAGVPLVTLRLPLRRGRIQPHDIRRMTLLRLGFELCRAVVRELILAPAAPAETSLRDLLAAAAARRASIAQAPARWIEGVERRALTSGWRRVMPELLPPGKSATVIGRRAVGADGTGVSRYASLPEEARAEMLAGARGAGDPVLEVGEEEAASAVVYAPCIQWDRLSGSRGEEEDEALLANLQFEHTFALRSDPWGYTSDYEQRKYEQTLSLLPENTQQALEIGCAEGAFTVKLAERVATVLACDVSMVALSRAARRCRHLGNVTFTRLDLFEQEPPEGYDLIVCSEMLYYASSQEQLTRAVRSLAQALEPGGCLLTANAHVLADDGTAPGFDWDVPFGAKRIAETVMAGGLFDLAGEVRTAPYRIQAYRRRERRRMPPRRRRMHEGAGELASAGEMSPEAASRFAPQGGEVCREQAPELPSEDPRLPILMYHRIADEGSPELARWRTGRRDFERQLEFLRANGYYSLTFEQWRAAANMRRSFPGKPIILTFDDGYTDFAHDVAPLLSQYGFRATVFIVSELVGASNVWDAELGESLALMGWEDIERLSAEGIDFGSHSSLHRPLVTLSQSELAKELSRSKRTLEERLGHAITSVSYPYGLHDATVESVAAACGYEYAVTTDEWPVSWSDSLLALPRLEVRGTETLEDFAKMLPS